MEDTTRDTVVSTDGPRRGLGRAGWWPPHCGPRASAPMRVEGHPGGAVLTPATAAAEWVTADTAGDHDDGLNDGSPAFSPDG